MKIRSIPWINFFITYSDHTGEQTFKMLVFTAITIAKNLNFVDTKCIVLDSIAFD